MQKLVCEWSRLLVVSFMGPCKVCSLRLGTNFGAPPVADKNAYLRLTVEKYVHLRFLPIVIYGHVALEAPNLRPRLTLKI